MVGKCRPDFVRCQLTSSCGGPGDSGGPAYLVRDAVLFVVGVSSAQSARPTGGLRGRYGVLEYYPRVSYFAEWIQSTTESEPE
jgi:secreted trypsin-like serine protease